jgi:hypothetical protein
MAVREGHRRQGVARALLADMVGRYPHAELACSIGKVPYFEALGFEVIGQRETQVLMSTRHYRSNGLRGFIDTTPIYRSLEVQQIHTYLLQKNGKRAMLDAEKQRDRYLDQTSRHVEEFRPSAPDPALIVGQSKALAAHPAARAFLRLLLNRA